MHAQTHIVVSPATLAAADHLLPIWYRAKTMARALGMDLGTLLDWVDAGLPHQSDQRGQIRIHGDQAWNWIRVTAESQPPATLQRQSYCLACQSMVMIQYPQVQQIGRLTVYRGICPTCGALLFYAKRD